MRVFVIKLIFYSCLLTSVICRPAKNEENDSYGHEYEEQYADPDDDGPTSEIPDGSPAQYGNVKQINETKPAIDPEVSEGASEHNSRTGTKVMNNVEEINRNNNEQRHNDDIDGKKEADDALQSNNIKSIQTHIAADSDVNFETANKRSKKEVGNENLGMHQKKSNIDKGIKNDEEIIRRQIKKLTKDEFDELLNSLSTDKRDLLLKIIDSSIDDENVEKREIAKKAGAAHNFIPKRERVQIGVNAEDPKQLTNELVGQNTTVASIYDTTNRQTNLKTDLNNENDPESIRADNGKIEGSNNEMKRGISNKENVPPQDNPNSEDKEYYDQEDPCAFLDQIKNEKKRDVSHETNHLADAFKSLEDSFSHANDYNDVVDLTPHVRVKRKNSDMTLKKRAAYLIDPIQSCVPHEHASHEEEGKEYGDEVSYDSSAYINENLVKNDISKVSDVIKALGSYKDDSNDGGKERKPVK